MTIPADDTPYDADLAFAHRLADAADALSRERFRAADLDVALKPDHSHVTDADRAVERAIRDLLAAERGDDALFGEEYGTRGTASRQWIVDPIDGTANFLRGVPIWATLIALSVEGRAVLGVVSSPALDTRWWAAAGAGAWRCDGARPPQRIRVSGVDEVREASLSFQSIAQWREAGRTDELLTLCGDVWRDRAYGDMWPYMLLAEGLVDVVAEPHGLKEYDLAALVPIVEEAGGRFTSVVGEPGYAHGSALATNGALHDAVLAYFSR